MSCLDIKKNIYEEISIRHVLSIQFLPKFPPMVVAKTCYTYTMWLLFLFFVPFFTYIYPCNSMLKNFENTVKKYCSEHTFEHNSENGDFLTKKFG